MILVTSTSGASTSAASTSAACAFDTEDIPGFDPVSLSDYLPPQSPQGAGPDGVKYVAQETFLPDQSLVVGRFMLAAWDHDLEGVDDEAANIVVVATQMLLKNILTAIITRCKSYKTKGHFQYDIGGDVPNIWLRNSSMVVEQTVREEMPCGGLGGVGIRRPPTIDEMEHAAAMEMACRSPNPSVSPDNLLYQNSVSPPLSAAGGCRSPAGPYSKSPGFNNLLTPAHILNSSNFFKGHNVPSSSPNYPDPSMQQRAGFTKGMEYQEKSDHKTQMSPNKMNFLPFRPEIPYLQAGSSYPFGVQNFQQPNPDFMKFSGPPRESVNPLIANPAAAILSTLLPPTLAAFSLPAQNVCAKCSISFRMTSDLVYHMRTHHKSETTNDPHRRKREEKLKCPVCNESFRERHHLTRHMTAHQDKEGDMEDVSRQGFKKSKQFYSHSAGSLVHK